MRRRAFLSVVGILVAFGIVGGAAFLVVVNRDRLFGGDSTVAVASWNAGNYEESYAVSGKNLDLRPLSAFWLVMRGMSAYQIGVAQINHSEALRYVDESIAALRKAMLVGAGKLESKAKYVLGKAYYRKGEEYADLAVEFLEQALAEKYEAPDIHEHLGLAYASLRDYRASVSAFTRALGDSPSDLLLLAIARSYLELGEHDQARAYLIRCAESSPDVAVAAQARLLLGASYRRLGRTADAEREYQAILEKDVRNADAYFALGEIFADSGDTVKARAEWRKALRIDPAHGPSRSRLGM